MSRKSRNKRKHKRTKGKHERQERNAASKPVQQTLPVSSARPRGLNVFLKMLGVLSAIVGVLTSVELFPRLSATSNPPPVSINDLAASFTVTNDSYIPLVHVKPSCFLWRVVQEGFVERNSMTTGDGPEVKLRPSEPLTVSCGDLHRTLGGPRFVQIDIAIVVFYRPWPLTFIHSRKVMRFVGRPSIDRQSIVWDKEPPEVLEKDLDEFLQQFPDGIPKLRSAFPFSISGKLYL